MSQLSEMDLKAIEYHLMTAKAKMDLFDRIGSNQWMKVHLHAIDNYDRLFRVKVYSYFLTLTTTPATEDGSLEFLLTQPDRRALKCRDFTYVNENIESNLHYHVLIRTEKPLTKGDFKHWAKHRGYVDFKVIKDTKSEADMKAYMSKEHIPVTLKGVF